MPYEDERDIGKAGQIVLSHLHFKTETECFGTLIKTKTENGNARFRLASES